LTLKSVVSGSVLIGLQLLRFSFCLFVLLVKVVSVGVVALGAYLGLKPRARERIGYWRERIATPAAVI
jgi:hypothetical protein